MRYIKLFENFSKIHSFNNKMHNESIEGLLVELKDRGFIVNFVPDFNMSFDWIENDIDGFTEVNLIKDIKYIQKYGMFLFISRPQNEDFNFIEIKEYIETVLDYLNVSGYKIKYQCRFGYDTSYVTNDINKISNKVSLITGFTIKIIEVN